MRIKNNILPCLLATVLMGFGSVANATGSYLSKFEYTGDLTITGFMGTAINPLATDEDSSTMNFSWEIDNSVGNFHDVMHAGATPTVTTGSGTVFFGTPLGNVALDISFLADFAEFLDEGHVDFPSGVAPAVSASSGSSLFSTGIATSVFGAVIDSTFEINAFVFDNNVISMDLTEISNPGATASLGAVLATGPDDHFVRGFEISAEVSAVPVPAAVWLFGTALLGLAGSRRKLI